MSREAIMVSNTAGDIRVTSERATIFSAAWRAASATNADLVTWSRSAASEISWSVASSVRSSRRRVLVVVMVVPPHTTVRDLYGNYERGTCAIDGTPRVRLRPQPYSTKVRQRPHHQPRLIPTKCAAYVLSDSERRPGREFASRRSGVRFPVSPPRSGALSVRREGPLSCPYS